MRAAILREVGQPLSIETIVIPEPQPDEVLVRMVASGVCHSDLSCQTGRLPVPLPSVLGHEGAGVVEAVGTAVTSVAAGDHVVLVWQAPCRRCVQCLSGQPHLCMNDGRKSRPPRVVASGSAVSSMNGLGTFADASVVLEGCVVRIPPDSDMDVAALLGCAGMTGIGAAINTAGVRAGATVAVVGCGGVGLSAIQGARLAGASQIVAIDPLDAKRVLALECGATVVVDPTENVDVSAEVLGLTDGVGVDHTIDCVGHGDTIRAAYHATRVGGSVTIVGVGPLTETLPLTLGELLKPRRVEFSVYGGVDVQRDVPRLLELDRRGALNLGLLVSEHIALDDVNSALTDLGDGSQARRVVRFDS